MEWPELELAPMWEAGTVGRSLAHLSTVLAPPKAELCECTFCLSTFAPEFKNVELCKELEVCYKQERARARPRWQDTCLSEYTEARSTGP